MFDLADIFQKVINRLHDGLHKIKKSPNHFEKNSKRLRDNKQQKSRNNFVISADFFIKL